MNTALPRRGLARHVAALITSAAAVAIVTAAIFALDSVAPVLSLGVLYVFAVLPVAVLFGLALRAARSRSRACSRSTGSSCRRGTRSRLQRLARTGSRSPSTSSTAVVVSELAARSRRARGRGRAARARGRRCSPRSPASLLESEHVQDELRGIAERVADALGVAPGADRARLGAPARSQASRRYELAAGERSVGRLFLEPRARSPSVAAPPAPRRSPRCSRSRSTANGSAGEALEAETLRRSDAIKTAILRAVSHDLRSPLTAIRAATRRARERRRSS